MSLVALLAALVAGDEAIRILPGDVTLRGPEARQTLVVQRVVGKQFRGQVFKGLKLTSGDPAVVRIENGTAVPVKNGSATVTAEADGRRTSIRIKVEGLDQPFRWSFRNHVQPVLVRLGCSTGACHGALAGKNGFKLSLRGYDDERDFRAITRHASGRRIVPSDPGWSLFLLKPTGAVPHKGGVRFSTDSLEYRVLAEWIASGTPPPRKDDARIERIEVLPDLAVLEPGTEQQMIVLAHFSDGAVRDVTAWTKYTASDSTVAVVGEDGRVKVTGNGEGAITAWHLSKIAIATVAVPYANAVSAEEYEKVPRRNFVDDLVLEKLRSLNLPPSPPAGDSEFLRRASLDTIGVLPTTEEVRAFLKDKASDKRDRLIERLLSRPEYVDYWTTKWSDLMLVSSRRLRKSTMWAYSTWIRNQVAANTPWDEFARRVVTATGGTIENGAGSFFLLHDDPTEMAETISQAFLGMSIQCAKCHNHPMEKWTNDQYYAFANLFARVRTKSGGRDGDFVIFSAPTGDIDQPRTGRPRPPEPLDGTPISLTEPGDRRVALAGWLVDPKNPYFSRSIVNRVWANFMGVGLVEAVDDMRKTNPPTNGKLLDAMAAYLADREFDLKALMRLILRSQTYQRSSRPLPGNATETRFYSRYYPRRLMAEVALDGLSQVTGVPSKFKGYPAGWRAMQLPDSNVDSYFLKSFGRPERIITCECERTSQPSMGQALHMANGDTLNDKLRTKGNLIDRLLGAKASDAKIVEELYLAGLSRLPRESERKRILAVLAEGTAGGVKRRELLEDLFWSVLSSRKFMFNH